MSVNQRYIAILAGLAIAAALVPSANAMIAGGVSVDVSDSFEPSLSPKQQARAQVAWQDANNFGGWFSKGGRSQRDVMAIFAIESLFNPQAFRENDNGEGDHAYGLGQMLGSTAGDFGYSGPDLKHIPNAVDATMRYLKWSWDYLANRLGYNPSLSQWIGAYNAGVGNVAKGRVPLVYVAKHTAAKIIV